jgi:hypothetical protein
VLEWEDAGDSVDGHAGGVASRDVLGELDLPAQDEDRHDALAAGAAGRSSHAANVLGWLPREVEQHDVLDVRRVDAPRGTVGAHEDQPARVGVFLSVF